MADCDDSQNDTEKDNDESDDDSDNDGSDNDDDYLALLVVLREVREEEAKKGHDVRAGGSHHLLRVQVPHSDGNHQLRGHGGLQVDLGLAVHCRG